MSSHIYNCKRVTLAIAVEMLEIYKSLLKLGVPVKAAKGEACYQMEAGRQSASHVRMARDPHKGKCSAYKMPKYVQGFDHVFKAAVGSVPKDKDLLKTTNTEATILRLFAKHRPDVYAKMISAKVNYKNVTGVTVKQVNNWLIKNRWQEWLKIKRGKDLFVKGWGKYDITKAVEVVSKQNRYLTRHSLCVQGYVIPATWVFESILKKRPEIVAWIGRYKDWFWPADKDLGLQRRSRWDEVLRHGDSEYADSRVSLELDPESFFQEVNRIEAEIEDQVSGETCDYNHLQGIPEMPTEFGIIKPIRSTTELVQAGKDLHQCAKSYNRRIIEGLSTLMVCTDEKGKPIAMAEIEHDEEGMILGQVSGPCNMAVSDEIQQAFQNCLTNILQPNFSSTL